MGKVLLVDDEEKILAAARRSLGSTFEIRIAVGPDAGLAILQTEKEFAVIVTDMSMPGMTGIEFLKRAAKIVPDTVNIMLTGNADIDVATDAFNEGSLFRYFQKPLPGDILAKGIRAALRQHQLVVAEKQLLTQTLSGTIKLLTNVLETMDPAAFARSSKMRGWLRELRGEVRFQKTWTIEMAARLAPIGAFMLPPTLLAKAQAGTPLDEDEKQEFEKVPLAAAELLRKIPRMEDVTAIITHMQTPYHELRNDPISEIKTVYDGARLLHILGALADRVMEGERLDAALTDFMADGREFDAQLVEIITPALLEADARNYESDNPNIHKLTLAELVPGDILRANMIKRVSGELILPEGNELNDVILNRIRNAENAGAVLEPILIER